MRKCDLSDESAAEETTVTSEAVPNTQPDMTQKYIDVLSHPIRRRILLLAVEAKGAPLSPVHASKVLGEVLEVVSYHVRCLASADVLKPVFTRQVRGAVEHFYAANLEAVQQPILSSFLSEHS